jgi:hypothetical protein
MDAEQAAALSRQQLHLFGEALRDAFTPDDLEAMLFYESEEWELPQAPTYPVRIQRLLANASREGWLHGLFNAAWDSRPGNRKLKTCVEALDPRAVLSGSTRAQRLLDTRYFDLSGIRSEVSEAVMTATSRVLAFGSTYPEPIYISKFADWLASYFGNTQPKQRMNLLPEIGNVRKHIRDVTRYRPELSSANVLCEIHAVGVPGNTMAAFWDGICTEIGSVGGYLVLLLSGGHNAVFPDGVTVLSPPTFRLADVDLWTHEMAERKGWREELARAWTQLLHEQAHYDGRLEVRYLYEAMDDTVAMARLHADKFLRQLEERCNANKTPA